MNDLYILSFEAKRAAPTTQDSMGNMNSPGSHRGKGNARAHTPDALNERGNRGAFRFTIILLKRISVLVRKASGRWRPVID